MSRRWGRLGGPLTAAAPRRALIASPRHGERTSYAPGTFSWVDLATTDAAAAKAFYAGMFGWEMEDNDAGGGAVYTMCRLDGDAVAGLYEMTEEMRATGAPPNWLS